MKINVKQARSCSYGDKRSHSDVKAIVIHYTGNNGDTARGNANYFATSNTRSAGAHFFVDRDGVIYRSIPMDRIAWAVGGSKYPDCAKTGGGKYYGIYRNANTVSIELCDIASKDPSPKQIKATKWLISYIRKHCPNAKKVIRHFDVTGKDCPSRMCGNKAGEKRWNAFLLDIGEKTGDKLAKKSGWQVSSKDGLNMRKKPDADSKKITVIPYGKTVKVEKKKGSWWKVKYCDFTGWVKSTYLA